VEILARHFSAIRPFELAGIALAALTTLTLACSTPATMDAGVDARSRHRDRANPGNPCAAGETCNESAARCSSTCPHNPDADGDGHRSQDCGGDDCDDNDANRFPGHTEVCDSLTHDEDCEECGESGRGRAHRRGISHFGGRKRKSSFD
jgi:hypothetical protein